MNHTPFYPHHLKNSGKMVPFAGWEMPVQYTSIKEEHLSVRNKVGIFDISHMGQVFVWGPEAEPYLQNLITNNLHKTTIGKGVYAHFLNEQGTVLDDIYVFRIEKEKFLVIVNASRREADLAWLEKHKANRNVEIMEAPQAAGLALQGPLAGPLMDKLSSQANGLSKNEIGEFEIGEVSTLISRTGYTGEDGFELFAPAGHLLPIWDVLFQAGKEFGLVPCGLGARDTLRTEVAYPLYGHELDDHHTPLEARLGWVVKFDKGPFIGREALLKQKSEGMKNKLFGFKVESGGVARPNGQILLNDNVIGTVTSGTFSPSLGFPIGMAYMPIETPDEGQKLTLYQGTRELTAVTVKMPFYKKNSVCGA
ncbi:glycine cleavage system protein T [bacterium F11]|nr:glycine cleavage system protein T [bacterium F11]